MAYTQDNRIIAIDTPLGKDVLLLHSIAGVEGISRLFGFNVSLLSTLPNVAFTDLIGQRVTISIATAKGAFRYINGFISRFAQTGGDPRFSYYEAEIVPWLWFLTRNANCRIFQQLSIPSIIQKVFTDHGFTDFSNRLQGTYSPREYCVQYRETDFNFVSRLMEQNGIFYYFEHDSGKHTLVMGDSPSVYKDCPIQSKFSYQETSGPLGVPSNNDVVTQWRVDQTMRSGKYTLTDFNFKTPSTSLLSNSASMIEVGGNSNYEIFDYPGFYDNNSDGDQVSKTRMEEEEAPYAVISGGGSCRPFIPGFRFKLDGHYRTDLNGTYVLTELHHVGTLGDSYASGDLSGISYSNRFVCIPSTVTFRPPRLTPHPFVQGPQTAIVVGPSGEEIYVDNYGRVKVQFHWDREGKRDQNSSCWIRVSSPWAGKNWGAISIPRIGQEVVVDFLEGDPDRPIITGRVYNAEQMPPYTLPDYQTRSTLLSRSSKGGATPNFNEIRFEDKKGSEQLFMNAEKDMDWRVEEESREFVGQNRHLIVKQDQKELVEGSKSQEVKQDHLVKIDGNYSHQAGMNRDEKTGTAWAHEAGQTIYIKGGMTVVIEAGMELSLKGAGGFVDIGPAGVTIQGTLVNINSGGSAASGSGPNVQDPQAPDQADDGSKGTKLA